MSEKQPTIFIEGIRFFKPRENAPSWIKGNVTINMQEFAEFIKKQDFKDPVMKIDLCKSEKKGTYYFTLNTYKPQKDTIQEANPF